MSEKARIELTRLQGGIAIASFVMGSLISCVCLFFIRPLGEITSSAIIIVALNAVMDVGEERLGFILPPSATSFGTLPAFPENERQFPLMALTIFMPSSQPNRCTMISYIMKTEPDFLGSADAIQEKASGFARSDQLFGSGIPSFSSSILL